MEAPLHGEIMDFLGEVSLPFYLVKRDMTVPDGNGGHREENDAEHSWNLTMIACMLAPHIDPNLDVGIIAQLCPVHDLVEVIVQDTSVWSSKAELATKEEREADALKILRTRWAIFPWLIQMLDIYERQDTNEARYVRSIDKYIAICTRFMERGSFIHQKAITKEMFDEYLIEHRIKAQVHLGAAAYYEAARADFEAHPEHFAPSKQM